MSLVLEDLKALTQVGCTVGSKDLINFYTTLSIKQLAEYNLNLIIVSKYLFQPGLTCQVLIGIIEHRSGNIHP